jgi:hypothetical protein
LPEIDIASWSNREIADALLVTDMLAHTLTDEHAGQFLDKLHGVVIAAARSRLERCTCR